MASVPPISRDALTHHLYIPKLYLQHGGIFEIPHIEFSYYPMNMDMLYLVSLYFKNDILPKFIHFLFALATAWMIYQYLRRRMNLGYALLGSLLFLSIPVIVCLSTIVYVDLGLVCFLFAAMMCLFKWIETGFKLKYLVISAGFCGLALGTKYNGLVGLFLLGLFVPFVYARYQADEPAHDRRAIGYSAIYIFVALLLFSPWMIRNIVYTGNPLYPLYKDIFPASASDDSHADEDLEHETVMNPWQIRRYVHGETGLEIALIPLRVFFQGRDDDPKYFDGRANPFLLILPVFAFFGIHANLRQVRTEKTLMLGFSVLFLLFACAQAVIRIRYFAPIFPPLVILSMFGLHHIRENILGENSQFSVLFKRIIIFAIVFVMLGLNAKYMVERFNYLQPLGYLTGKVSRDEYIQKFRPEYASMQYANQHLTKNSLILGIYLGNRGYYSDIDIVFSLSLLQNLAARANLPKDIAKNLKERGITHLLMNYELFNFWVKDYSLHEKQMLKDFFEQHTVTEFSKDKNGLLRVKY
jgi:4-amino-4-deoxy-L-arabinose transferase-like glycosyltransferase